jgi:hypothetical protein
MPLAIINDAQYHHFYVLDFFTIPKCTSMQILAFRGPLLRPKDGGHQWKNVMWVCLKIGCIPNSGEFYREILINNGFWLPNF